MTRLRKRVTTLLFLSNTLSLLLTNNRYNDINETLQLLRLDYSCSPVVLPVPVVDCLGVVHDVEQTRPSNHELKGGGQSGPGWENVFVAPAPVGPGAGPTHGHRTLAAA